MRHLALAVAATIAFALPVAASHVGSVEDAILEAMETYKTDPAAAMDAVYALATESDIPEACARWADVTLIGFLLIEDGTEYPDSWAVRLMFEWSLEALPVMKNDCLLAL